MALQEQKRKSGTQGPSMPASDLPPNPSDAIFAGQPLPTRPAISQTMRRPFSPELVTRNPLHYLDGPGTDEVVCSGRSNYSGDHRDSLENSFGQDAQKYSNGPNGGRTERGQGIRGT